MRYFVTLGSRTLEVELSADGVTVDGEPVTVDLRPVAGTRLRSVLVDGASHAVVAHRTGPGRWDLHGRGRRLGADVVDERTRAIREMTGAGAGPGGPRPVRAPMPGLMVKVEVEVGDRVEAGQGVAVVEAMKMENELRAEVPGIVSAIRARAGDAVEKDQVLLEFDPVDGGESGS